MPHKKTDAKSVQATKNKKWAADAAAMKNLSKGEVEALARASETAKAKAGRHYGKKHGEILKAEAKREIGKTKVSTRTRGSRG